MILESMITVPAATCGVHTRNVDEDSYSALASSGNVPSSFHQELHRDTGIALLPAEILSHVFMLGAEDHSEDNSDSPLLASSPSHFGTLCSHVCKYWRNVATETPQLWAFIDFQEGSPFEKAREWIFRSKAVPLTLEIDHNQADDQPLKEEQAESFMLRMSEKISAIVSLIIPHANRLFSLHIDAERYDIIWIWVDKLETCPATPILESLSLFCREETFDNEHFQPAELRSPRRALLDAPKLNTVIFWGVHIDWETATFLKNLKSLELAYHAMDVRPSIQQFVRVLGRSPRLESLSLEESAPVPGDWPYGRTSLKFLHTVSIIGVNVAVATAVIEHLEFPGLRNLTLDLDQDSSVDPFVTAVCKGDRPRFRDVEVLKLISFHCQWPAAIQFLESMPRLSSVTLDFNFLPDHFYHALVKKPDGQQSICPVLTTLKLSGLDGDDLRKLVIARKTRPGVKSILKLFLDETDDIVEDTVEWLKNNVQLLEFYEPSDDEEDSEEDDSDDDEQDDYAEDDHSGDEGYHLN